MLIVFEPSVKDLGGKRGQSTYFADGGLLFVKDRFGIETVIAPGKCIEVVVLYSFTLEEAKLKPRAKEGNLVWGLS